MLKDACDWSNMDEFENSTIGEFAASKFSATFAATFSIYSRVEPSRVRDENVWFKHSLFQDYLNLKDVFGAF